MFSLCLFFPLCSQKMGKKSRVKTQKSGTGATASVSPKETLNLTSELLQSKFCSRQLCACGLSAAWEGHGGDEA